MDLIAVGRAALLPDDDLTLACALKSPLLGFDDDALMRIAAGRSGSLADALTARTKASPRAPRRLAGWRARAKALSPFAFYARLLGPDGGRRALIGRLGPEAADPIDEFLALALAHERREASSLHNFLSPSRNGRGRDQARHGGRDRGRARTDCPREQRTRGADRLSARRMRRSRLAARTQALLLSSPRPRDPAVLAWAKKSAQDADAVAAARAEARAAQAGDIGVSLYVAMTRAAQRLIVAGHETSKRRPSDCWYDLILSGLGDALVEAPAPFRGGEKILRFGEGFRAEDLGETAAVRDLNALPGWLAANGRPRPSPPLFNPSRAGGVGEGDRERALEGRLAHALLERLPDLPPQRRPDAATASLDLWESALAESVRAALASKVLAAIGAPELSPIFATGSRSEVALAGVLSRPGRPTWLIAAVSIGLSQPTRVY